MRVRPGCNYYSTLENEKSKTKQNTTKKKTKTPGNEFELPVTLYYIILRQQLQEESGNSISRLRVI